MLGKTVNMMVNSVDCMLCTGEEELKQHQTDRYTEKKTKPQALISHRWQKCTHTYIHQPWLMTHDN